MDGIVPLVEEVNLCFRGTGIPQDRKGNWETIWDQEGNQRGVGHGEGLSGRRDLYCENAIMKLTTLYANLKLVSKWSA